MSAEHRLAHTPAQRCCQLRLTVPCRLGIGEVSPEPAPLSGGSHSCSAHIPTPIEQHRVLIPRSNRGIKGSREAVTCWAQLWPPHHVWLLHWQLVVTGPTTSPGNGGLGVRAQHHLVSPGRYALTSPKGFQHLLGAFPTLHHERTAASRLPRRFLERRRIVPEMFLRPPWSRLPITIWHRLLRRHPDRNLLHSPHRP